MAVFPIHGADSCSLTGNINLISSGIQYALFIVFTSVIFFYIDKTSRRGLLMYGALSMAVCHFVVGGVLSAGEYVPGGVDGNLNVVIRVTGAKSHTVIAFSYLLIICYALTLAPVAWVYAAEVWSLETRASGMVCITGTTPIHTDLFARVFLPRATGYSILRWACLFPRDSATLHGKCSSPSAFSVWGLLSRFISRMVGSYMTWFIAD